MGYGYWKRQDMVRLTDTIKIIRASSVRSSRAFCSISSLIIEWDLFYYIALSIWP